MGLRQAFSSILPRAHPLGPRHFREWTERLDLPGAPPSAETSEYPERMLGRLLLRARRAELIAAAGRLPIGVWHEHHELVGDRHQGTVHPHEFLVRRTEPGLELVFVDPEPLMGARHPFRPSASNMLQLRMAAAPGYPLALAALRYRRNTHEAAGDPSMKLRAQTEAAIRLLESGADPEGLAVRGQDVVFRLSVPPSLYGGGIFPAAVQCRFSSPAELAAFLRGDTEASGALRDKAEALRLILGRFHAFLEENRFLPVDARARKRLGI